MTTEYLDIQVSLSHAEEELLFDPQTSGGLLLSVPDTQAQDLLRALHNVGIQPATQIGEVVDGPPGLVVV